jgi:hypothetical protein
MYRAGLNGWLIRSGRPEREIILNLSRSNLEPARARRIKEAASTLRDYLYMEAAGEAWKKLLKRISLCRIPEMIIPEAPRKYLNLKILKILS